MFRTKYDRKEIVSNPGNPIRIVYAGELQNNKIVVVEKGKEDLYAFINSHADSVNIHVLMKRFINGDKEALMQRVGAYIDISSLPTNINEFMKLANNAQNLFDTLPIEVKQSFNNNVIEFISTIGDKEWIEKMSKSPAQINYDALQESVAATEAHKAAIKNVESNSVYGDQPVIEPISKDVNPLTGNEV